MSMCSRYFFGAAALWLTGVMAFAQQVPRPAGEFAINMMGGGQTLLSQYTGKVVVLAFISTTCPHCQHTTQLLAGIQNEYGPRGVQILAAAFNDGAAQSVPEFIARFRPSFPVGFATRESVLEYEQADPGKPNYVPEILFIDRHRIIRAQYHGSDPFFKDTDQEKNVRAQLDLLLKEPVAARKSPRQKQS
jgi:thiol-disulfide isomerase/thioredoxin